MKVKDLKSEALSPMASSLYFPTVPTHYFSSRQRFLSKSSCCTLSGGRSYPLHPSDEKDGPSFSSMADLKSTLLNAYSQLKSELLTEPAFEWSPGSLQWVERMLDYNVPGGKLNRGLSVIDSNKLLKQGDELTQEDIFLASALGWCTEWLVAALIVMDDIMDASHTRRGHPCWFRLPEVGMIAVNDGVILRNHVPRILIKHFREKPYYVDLVDLFNEVEFQTISGQMIDLITVFEGEKNLTNYTLSLHRRIAQYKTAYCSFYLPVACALLLAGENLEKHTDVHDILVQMGIYFQVQNDYLDCYGDPKVTGKIIARGGPK